jgi:PAS domain S-box-containing protein
MEEEVSMPHAKIVIVEDDSQVARFVSRLLKKLGYTISACVSSGEEALRVVEQSRPDLVLMDIGLPGLIDGTEAAMQIRFRLNIPVIYLTGDAEPSTVNRAKLAEPLGYILKPFNPEELRTTIETALYQFQMIRKRAKEALRHAERRYQLLFENAMEGIYQSTPDGRFVTANPALARMFGYKSPAELLSSVTDIERQLYVKSEGRREFQRVLHEMGVARRFESNIRRTDGTEMWISENARAVCDENGQLLYYEGLVEDITERKRAEQQLSRERELMNALMEYTPDHIYFKDTESRFLRVSRAMAKWLGLDEPAQAIGKTDFDFFDLEYAEPARTDELKIMETGEPMVGIEEREVWPDGRVTWVSTTKVPLRDQKGQSIGTFGTSRNITERKRAEEERAMMDIQLRQALKLEAVGQLAAGIAHEINTPTQYVGDNTRFLQDAFADLSKALQSYDGLLQANRHGEVAQELVAEVEAAIQDADLGYLTEEIPKAIAQSLEGVERVATIVRAMKEFSHSGGEEKQSIDLNHAIDNTLTVCRNEWKYVAEMVTDFDPNLPPVPCHPGELNQVILNLIINASHAIADVAGNGENGKGTITVRTRRNGNWAEIRISDTGCGIREEHRRKVFTPFFTTKEVGKGTGQGLAISHTVVVKKHGGTIEFETELGKGTTFIIRLPLDPDISRERHVL